MEDLCFKGVLLCLLVLNKFIWVVLEEVYIAECKKILIILTLFISEHREQDLLCVAIQLAKVDRHGCKQLCLRQWRSSQGAGLLHSMSV